MISFLFGLIIGILSGISIGVVLGSYIADENRFKRFQAISFIKEQMGSSYYTDRLIAILEFREEYPHQKGGKIN